MSTKYPPPPQQRLLTIDAVRSLFGNESQASIYRAIKCGELDARKRGSRTLITERSVQQRLQNLPQAQFKFADLNLPKSGGSSDD